MSDAVAGHHRREDRAGWYTRWRLSELIFAGLLILGAVLVFVETRAFSFYGDDWDFVIDRRGLALSTLLRPHGPNLVVLPILIYKVLLALFGGGSNLPFRLLAAADLVLVALALGVACRERWGRWAGLIPVALLVTLGPAAISTLWSFQVGYSIAITTGIVSLLAAWRGGRLADVVCCLSLIVSLASGSQGVGFVVGDAVVLVLLGNWRRRSWVVLVPAILYVLWYAKYGHQYSNTSLALWGSALGYCFQSLAATLEAAVGLSTVSSTIGALDMSFGTPMALAVVGVGLVALFRGWRPSPLFWGIAVSLVVLWIAAALSNAAGNRAPNDPRYLVTNLTVLAFAICAAVPRVSLDRRAAVIVGLAVAVVCVTNARNYGQVAGFYRTADATERAELGALEMAQGGVAASYSPGVVDPELVNVTAAKLYSAQQAFGLSEDSPAQLLRQPAANSGAADTVLRTAELSFSALASAPAPTSGAPPKLISGTATRRRNCLVLGSSPVYVQGAPGTLLITAAAGAGVTVDVSRVSPTYVSLVTAEAGRSISVSIGGDRYSDTYPWRLQLTGADGLVCARSSS